MVAAVIVNGDSITYTPNANFNGMDTLTYIISDGNGGMDTAEVIITITPVNDAPVAVDDAVFTPEDVPVTYHVQGNDSDVDGDALTTTIVTNGTNGTAIVSNDSILYTPNLNFNGYDTITYVISDGNGGSDTAIFVIHIGGANDAPVAVDDLGTTPEDTPITIDVQANDSDIDLDPLTTTAILSGPSNGAAVIVNGDSITYTPNANFNGMDTLTYIISDGNGGMDTAEVIITITPVNDAPVAVDDAVFTPEDVPVTYDVQGNDSDVDGDALTTTIVTNGTNGTAIVSNDSILYTPNLNFNGYDTITYVISDGNGGSDTAIFVIHIGGANDAPVAVDDAVTTPEDIPVTIDVQSNDSDIDLDPLTTTTILSGPSNGAAVIVNGDSITYTPNANFNGMDTLTYIISDGNGGMDTAEVIITITPINDAPVAVDDNATTNEDTPVTVDVQSNDSDLDGDALTTTILSGPSNGTVAVVNGDSIVYTPNANFNGTDTLTYVIAMAMAEPIQQL